MFITILIIFISLIALLVLHEFGHFVAAKKLGVEVEEFGIGYPPRIFGKKIGQTFYSLNLLPFGAFVKIKGEDGGGTVEDYGSFSNRPIWQRAVILLAGVLSFWVVAFLILTVISAVFGLPMVIDDEATGGAVEPYVQLVQVAKGSPAEEIGLRLGDRIIGLAFGDVKIEVNKVKEIQKFTKEHLGQEIILTIQRGKEIIEKKIVPRASHPADEGAMGVALARTSNFKYSWFRAPVQGFLVTARTTVLVPQILGGVLIKAVRGEKIAGVKLVGPVGVGHMMQQALNVGWGNFLFSLSMIAIFLAISNLLPIPALDGGRILFLCIEKARKKPVNPKIEAKVNSVFFTLLVLLMVFVTVRDIWHIFS